MNTLSRILVGTVAALLMSMGQPVDLMPVADAQGQIIDAGCGCNGGADCGCGQTGGCTDCGGGDCGCGGGAGCAAGGCGCGGGGGCGCGLLRGRRNTQCPDCAYCGPAEEFCQLVVGPDKEEKECFEVDFKTICIPRVVTPWRQEHHCEPQCAEVRSVKVLKTRTYECPSCKCSWEVVKPPLPQIIEQPAATPTPTPVVDPPVAAPQGRVPAGNYYGQQQRRNQIPGAALWRTARNTPATTSQPQPKAAQPRTAQPNPGYPLPAPSANNSLNHYFGSGR